MELSFQTVSRQYNEHMKKLILLATMLLLCRVSFAQTMNFSWVKTMGDTLFDEGKQVTTDLQGNVYFTGYFKGTADFDPGSAVFNLTSTDLCFFLSKLDAQGNFIYAKQFTGITQSEGNALQVDASGNVFLAGAFSNQTDLDPGPATYFLTAQSTDAFVCKLNASGDFVWAKQFGGAYGEFAYDIRVAATGHIYFTGEFYDLADFDPGPATYNLSAPSAAGIYVCKLNSDGSFVWAQQVSGAGMFNRGYALDLDQHQNIYYTGYFSGTADFDPGAGVQNLTSNGSQDIFISKLDSAGNYVWAKRIGGTYIDVAYDLVCDNSGNTYFTGTYASTVDFNPGSGVNNLISGTNSSGFVCKFDPNGNYTWAKSFFGQSASCIGWGIDIDAANNVYTTGFFYGTIDFDPGSMNMPFTAQGSGPDNFINKLDGNGNYASTLTLSGSGATTGRCVHVANDGSVYLTGYFSETVDFDPGTALQNVTGNTNHDIYVLKLTSSSPTATTKVLTNASLVVYPNPVFQGKLCWNSNNDVLEVALFSLEGKKVRAVQSPKDDMLDVTGIPEGTYIFQLQSSYDTYRASVQIQK